MKRILFVTRNFPPLIGGMERLAHNAYMQLGRHFSCDLVGPRGSGEHAGAAGRVHECTTRPLAAFLASALLKTLRASRRTRYDIILAGSGVTAPICLLAARSSGAACITFIHGLDLIADNRIYRKMFLPAIRRCDLVIANSSNTAELAAAAGVPRSRIRILHPGVELPAEIAAGRDFRAGYGVGDRPLLLFAGRLIPRKGIAEFILHALPQVVANDPETLLAIIGTEPRHALNRGGGVLDAIRAAIRKAGLERNVLMLGSVDDTTLQSAFAAADLMVFPLRPVAGDVEGFGMVAIEAAACGLPCVAFAEGGVADAISNGQSGYLVPSGDYNGMSDTIIALQNGELLKPDSAACRAHAARFQWQNFGDRLVRLITETASPTAGKTE